MNFSVNIYMHIYIYMVRRTQSPPCFCYSSVPSQSCFPRIVREENVNLKLFTFRTLSRFPPCIIVNVGQKETVYLKLCAASSAHSQCPESLILILRHTANDTDQVYFMTRNIIAKMYTKRNKRWQHYSVCIVSE